MVDSFLGKKYKLATSENFEDFMKGVGVNILQRKMGAAATPTVDLTKDGEEYSIASTSTFKNFTIKFKPDVECDQETPDGRKLKSTITVDGSTLHEIQTNPDGKKVTIDRIFSSDELVMVLKVDNVVCNRVYKAVP